MISLVGGFLAAICLGIWALDRRESRALEASRDRLVATVANRAIATIVRDLKTENESLKKQLGMSPMRRPGIQDEPEVAATKTVANYGAVQLGQYKGPMIAGACSNSGHGGGVLLVAGEVRLDEKPPSPETTQTVEKI